MAFFSCGEEGLDNWLCKEALNAHRGGLSRTHVWCDSEDDPQVVGYFTLSPTVIEEQIGRRRGSPGRYPGYLLGKLAVHQDLQEEKAGHGSLLLGQALIAVVNAADVAGGKYLVVDPIKNRPQVREFYRKAGFKDIPGNERMYIDIETLRES